MGDNTWDSEEVRCLCNDDHRLQSSGAGGYTPDVLIISLIFVLCCKQTYQDKGATGACFKLSL